MTDAPHAPDRTRPTYLSNEEAFLEFVNGRRNDGTPIRTLRTRLDVAVPDVFGRYLLVQQIETDLGVFCEDLLDSIETLDDLYWYASRRLGHH